MDKQFFLHQIATPGQPGNITEAEASALRADLAAYSAQLASFGIASLTDVALVNLADGEVLQFDEGSGTWVNATITAGIERVLGSAGELEGPFHTLNIFGGLTYNVTTPGILEIKPILAGTGSDTIARGDHVHTLRGDSAYPFDASGSLSSGTRTFVSDTLTGLDPNLHYRITGTLEGEVRGEGTGAGRSHPSITIHGNTRTRFGGSRGYVRTVSGVDRPYGMRHPGVTVTGVTSVAVSASLAHIDGDPKYVGGGELMILVRANR